MPRFLHRLYAFMFGGHERGNGDVYLGAGRGWVVCDRHPKNMSLDPSTRFEEAPL